MDSNTREMLKDIRERDGAIRFLAARGVIVSWSDGGYSVEVDGEEYGWYSTIGSMKEDLTQLQEDRVFIKGEWA